MVIPLLSAVSHRAFAASPGFTLAGVPVNPVPEEEPVSPVEDISVPLSLLEFKPKKLLIPSLTALIAPLNILDRLNPLLEELLSDEDVSEARVPFATDTPLKLSTTLVPSPMNRLAPM